MPSLTLRMLGTLAFLGTAAITAGVVLGLAYALGRGDHPLLRRLGVFGAVVLAGYALLLAAGPAVTPPRALAPGQELSFCGFDCHLHVSALGARREDGLDVTLRFRSDARRAPEFPGRLAVRVVDEAGREFAPVEPLPRNELPAGETATHTLRFPVPDDAVAPRVTVTWTSWLDWLVPGPGNPMVQRKATLELAGITQELVRDPRPGQPR
jgi:hypothetical protein